MKKFIFASLCLVAIELHAATVLTVSWRASTDNGFGLSDGTPLAVGNQVRIGAFDFPDATLNAQIQGFISSGDLVGLESHFTLFDTASIGNDAFAGSLATVPLSSRGGLFEKSSGAVTVPALSPLFGKQIFLWAFKTTANNAVQANYLNVTQTGIFSLNNSTAWRFPADTGDPESRPIELTNLSDTAGTATTADTRIVTGGFGVANPTLATVNSPGNTRVFTLAPVTPVPEPGVFGLLLFGLLALTGRCRQA